MTDREIQKMLKQVYASPETEKGKAFLRRYEKRSLQLVSIIKTESRYMGLPSVLTELILCIFLIILARSQNQDMVWTLSSFLPVSVLIPMLLLSRSERCGMDELEAASRFSLRFIRIVRMFILGGFSTILLTAVSVILYVSSMGSLTDSLVFVVFPYLVSTYGSMVMTRKWHSKDNILGVLAVCMSGGLIPFAIKSVRLSGQFSNGASLFFIVVLLAAIIRECMLYVKESEDLSWNLC